MIFILHLPPARHNRSISKTKQNKTSGGFLYESSRLAAETAALVRAKDAAERKAVAALEEKARRLSEATNGLRKLEASARKK